MFIVAKSFTNKRGEMFLKIFPRQYPSIETAHAAMQSDYQELPIIGTEAMTWKSTA